MITPTHYDVPPPFGLLFTVNFHVMVDEYAGISEVIEQYTARGTIIGDTMNWWCAPGATTGGNKEMEVAGQYGEPL